MEEEVEVVKRVAMHRHMHLKGVVDTQCMPRLPLHACHTTITPMHRRCAASSEK